MLQIAAWEIPDISIGDNPLMLAENGRLYVLGEWTATRTAFFSGRKVVLEKFTTWTPLGSGELELGVDIHSLRLVLFALQHVSVEPLS